MNSHYSNTDSDEINVPHTYNRSASGQLARAYEPFFKLLEGDTKCLVKSLPQVHCVVTSPPYFHQREYGADIQTEVGREASVDCYIDHLVGLFSSIPLHPCGSVWINIGDKRNKSGGLMNIPCRFILAMSAAGFELVDHVVWAKSIVFDDGSTAGNHMPEPCWHRFNGNGHEDFLRFTRCKPSEAWTDPLAVMIPRGGVEPVRYLPDGLMTVNTALNGRVAPNVWQTRVGQTKEAHHAVFSTTLVERPIAFTCPLLVDPDGLPARRYFDQVDYDDGRQRVMGKRSKGNSGRLDSGRRYTARMPLYLGWAELAELAKPGIVLDPFCGTGSTGEAALKLGRSFIGIDLYGDYLEIARRRCARTLGSVDYNGLYERILHPFRSSEGGCNAQPSADSH